MPEIHDLSALQLRAAYASRQLSPVEALDAILARVDALEPSIHAFIRQTRESALSQARAAESAWSRSETKDLPVLMGIPVTLKDLVDVEGVPTTMGSLVSSSEPAAQDELFVERLRRAGAVFLGKTNTSEFGLAAQTMNRLGPATSNPWHLSRTAGGSSGGAAAACAAGFGPLHYGTDGGGSVRVPAAYCGVIGVKPTGRRVPRRRRGAGMSQISTDGILARSVADAALGLSVIADSDRRDPATYRGPKIDYSAAASPTSLDGLRVAWTTDLAGQTACEVEITEQVERAARCLAAAGATVIARSPQIEDPLSIFPILSAVGAAANYGDLCEGREDELSDYTRGSLRRGKRLTGVQVAEAYAGLDRLRRQMDAWFEDVDVLLTPTSAIAAHSHGARIDEIAGQSVNPWMISIMYTPLANLIQAPAIALPSGCNADGLPISVQVMAREGNDATVLRCAASLEAAGFAVTRLAPA